MTNGCLQSKDNPLKIIQIKSLVKHYQKDKVKIPALQGLSLDVEKGAFVAVIGPSGSGKSTLLNLIGGLDKATSGRIVVKDRDLTQMNPSELVQHRRKTVGMIFQSFNLISPLTAAENVALALAFADTPRRTRKKLASEMLHQLGLSHRLNHRPSEISGGEAQRVAIARALANQPDILLADEPTGNLDSKTSREIVSLLKKLNKERNVTVLMVTHEEDLAKQVSHQMVYLLDGKINRQEQILSSP